MNHPEVVPILAVVQRNRYRRETDNEKIDGWYKFRYNNSNKTARPVTKMHFWIDEFTSGQFYLTPFMVAFEDEKDFTIFSLWYKE